MANNTVQQLVAGLSPLNRTLAAQFGCRVALYARSEDSGGVESYAARSGLTAVDVQLLSPEQARKARIFGLTSTCHAVLLIPQQSTGIVTVPLKDGVKVLTGPFANRAFVAEAIGTPDSIGFNVIVPLVESRSGVAGLTA